MSGKSGIRIRTTQAAQVQTPRHSARLDTLLRRLMRISFSWKVRSGFYRVLAAKLDNKIALKAILELYQRQLIRRRKTLSAEVIVRILHRLNNEGDTLAEAMRPWLPPDELLMLISGEEAGQLAAAALLIRDVKGRISKVLRTIKKAFIGPAIQLAALFGFVWSIGEFVVPKLTVMLPAERASGEVAMLYAMGNFATSPMALVPLMLAGVVIAIGAWAMPRWSGFGRVFAERFFPFSFYRDIQGYMWLISFAALMAAGRSDTDAMRIQQQNANPWLARRLDTLRDLMTNGGASLPSALLTAGFNFPSPDLIDEIESVWGMRDSIDRLLNVTRDWADELEETTIARIATFGGVFTVAMYGVLLFVVTAANSLSMQLASVPALQ